MVLYEQVHCLLDGDHTTTRAELRNMDYSGKNLNKCLLFNQIYCFKTFMTNILHKVSLCN